MEIALLNKTSVRIKGKNGTVIINPSGKTIDANGFILLDGESSENISIPEETLVLNGPGEYEFGGFKISGIRNEKDTLFSLRVDKLEILAGRANVLEKEHNKLKEHHIVLLYNKESIDPSFVTALATNVVVFYGEKAEETMNNLAKEGYRRESKFSISFEKLPQEVEKILLQ